jgi:hypothetical protein
MEETITVNGTQYILTYNTPITAEQRMQTISDIRRQSEYIYDNEVTNLGVNNSPQGSAHATINMQAPANITVTNISVGGTDCSTGTCPDTICTSIGCVTETRNVAARYTNSGDISANIIPNLAVAKTSVNVNNAIKNGADRLVQTQNNDGTWEWSDPDTDPTTTQYPGTNNTLGVTARGLVKAYSATGNVNYLNAAKKTADLLVSKTPDGFGPDDPGTTGKHKTYAQDITFLADFADAWARAGNDASVYSTKANAYMTLILYSPNRFCTAGCFGNGSIFVQNYFNSRQPNLYGWDLAAYVEAAVKTGHMDFAQEIVSNMIPYSSYLSSTATGTYPQGFSHVLGLSGYLQSYILTGIDYSTIEAKLLSELNQDGSFKTYAGMDDGIKQTAAYALTALSSINIDMTSTVNYLINSQSAGGQWIENDGYEYTEVDSEVIVALGTIITPYLGASITIPAVSYVDIAFNNVILKRGMNNICAGWTPSI